MPNPTGVGFFGKLPGVGDFVQRRLPSRFVDIWDHHFEHAVEASRGTLGNDWHEAYRSSPVWRFVLAPQTCTESAWAGVMGPASDRVGRCFPMVIAAPLAGDAATVAQALRHGDGWFDALERVHLAGQSDASIHVDTFDAQVAALPGPLDTVGGPSQEWQGIDWNAASHWRLPLPTRAAAGPGLAELWTRLMVGAEAWCLWWTHGAGRVPPSILVTHGLPQPAAYAGFLDASRAGAPWQAAGAFDRAGVPTRMPAEPWAPPRQPTPHDDDCVPSHAAAAVPSAAVTSRALLPDDLSELFADLAIAAPPLDRPMPALEPRDAGQPQAAAPAGGVAVRRRDDGALILVAADDGPGDPRRQAAAQAGAVAGELAAADLAAGTQALRERLLALHPRLRQRSEDLIDPVREDGAVIAVQVSGRWAALLRIGSAAAWLWRRGQLRSLFAGGEASPVAADAGLGGDFDDLLFSRTSPLAPGLGAAMAPICDEVVCAVEAGDRLLLLATHTLVQLSPELLAHALALPSGDEAQVRIATVAGLGSEPTQWPLAVIEVTP